MIGAIRHRMPLGWTANPLPRGDYIRAALTGQRVGDDLYPSRCKLLAGQVVTATPQAGLWLF